MREMSRRSTASQTPLLLIPSCDSLVPQVPCAVVLPNAHYYSRTQWRDGAYLGPVVSNNRACFQSGCVGLLRLAIQVVHYYALARRLSACVIRNRFRVCCPLSQARRTSRNEFSLLSLGRAQRAFMLAILNLPLSLVLLIGSSQLLVGFGLLAFKEK